MRFSSKTRSLPKKGQVLFRLKECMALYQQRTGRRLTYRDLSKLTGLGLRTVQAIAREGSRYNATVRTLERFCNALGVTISDLVYWRD